MRMISLGMIRKMMQMICSRKNPIFGQRSSVLLTETKFSRHYVYETSIPLTYKFITHMKAVRAEGHDDGDDGDGKDDDDDDDAPVHYATHI